MISPNGDRPHLRAVPLSRFEPRRASWAIPRVVPYGTLTLCAGEGGLGKSSLGLSWLATLTRAGHTVLVISYEDDPSRVIRQRFAAVGGDADLLRIVLPGRAPDAAGAEDEDTADSGIGMVTFPDDLGDLDELVVRYRARAVMIDPVSASLTLELDSHRDQDVRRVLSRLQKIAAERDAAIIRFGHLNKGPSNDPYLRIGGSAAFYNAARSVVTVSRDADGGDDSRFVSHQKCNYARLAPVERWRVLPAIYRDDAGEHHDTSIIAFVEVAADVRREDVLGRPAGRSDRGDEAQKFLLGILAAGESSSRVVKGAAERAGISERTLQRARTDLDVLDRRTGNGSTTETWWRLSHHEPGIGPNAGPPPRPPSDAERGREQRFCSTCDRRTPHHIDHGIAFCDACGITHHAAQDSP